jgi:DNA-binding NtrC family response regulator
MSQSGSLATLTSYLETLPEPHIVCDRGYRVVAANAAYRARCPGVSVLGQTCYRASHRYKVPCDRIGEDCPVKESLETGLRATAIHRHFRDSGETFERIDVAPVRDDRGDIAWFIERIEEVSSARGLAHAQGFVGASPRFTAMLDAIARAAPSNVAILLLGESGTGKDLAAQAIHDLSRRASGPFVAIDCSGLPETLFESELFGHEKGAYTGAVSRKFGLVEQAAGGTLFVDEVGDIPLALQVKLLRLLETGTFRRVGGAELRRADFRLVSATHRPLKRMVADGSFRQDLYYRLSAFPIRLPALRDRRDDIPALVVALLRRVAPGRDLSVSPAAMAALAAYDWPGNVRELRNAVERASLMCDSDIILSEHLSDDAEDGELVRSDTDVSPQSLLEIERRALLDAAASHRGTRKALADKLGVSPRSLYRRLAAARASAGRSVSRSDDASSRPRPRS